MVRGKIRKRRGERMRKTTRKVEKIDDDHEIKLFNLKKKKKKQPITFLNEKSKALVVAGWIANPSGHLQGYFRYRFEPRHLRPSVTEGLNVSDNLVVDWIYSKTKSIKK
ncbi:hypothetical protein PoB_004520500 [Plakobranchus ocellatus]|uniref:Uncharacterized protein n=1 Tax=Plakobranchus ocellatus TaxID=259542 RepID=A0AAV4BDR1_9GAST|nr:hypothetical protein PoB_004520500 [Plakobranchus ocellatus]